MTASQFEVIAIDETTRHIEFEVISDFGQRVNGNRNFVCRMDVKV